MTNSPKRQKTLCAHSPKVHIANEPLALPIYQTSTYRFESTDSLQKYLEGDVNRYLYTRYENPTLRAVQEKIAELEKGDACYVFSSGMAAITSSILSVVKQGDEILASDSIYGRTQLFLENWLPGLGVQTRFIPLEKFPDIDRYFSPRTKIVYIETPTNPTLRIIDISATADAAHRHGASLFIDSTFASPVNQNPLEQGADVVLHSLTKYMGGHSDLLGGASIFSNDRQEAIREAIRTFGGSMDPFAAFLLERGLKTLPLRIAQQNATATYLAERCSQHGAITKVNYPGLKNHPQHLIASRQMRGFGGMFSFDLPDYDSARKFVDRLEILAHATSLGGVESLVSLPLLTSHYGQPKKNLEAAGISEGTVRVSVGLEDPDDLWSDIEQALESE